MVLARLEDDRFPSFPVELISVLFVTNLMKSRGCKLVSRALVLVIKLSVKILSKSCFLGALFSVNKPKYLSAYPGGLVLEKI